MSTHLRYMKTLRGRSHSWRVTQRSSRKSHPPPLWSTDFLIIPLGLQLVGKPMFCFSDSPLTGILSKRNQKRKGASDYETPNTIELNMATMPGDPDDILERCWSYCHELEDKSIICGCSQDPELKALVECMKKYRRKYEWKRGHKTRQDFICEKCHKPFKREDCMRKHFNRICRLKS
jgi:hypothetical protein